MARALKFRIKVEEGLYYPYGENKGADQLCNYCAADLPLCFRTCKKTVFSLRGSTYRGSLHQLERIMSDLSQKETGHFQMIRLNVCTFIFLYF